MVKANEIASEHMDHGLAPRNDRDTAILTTERIGGIHDSFPGDPDGDLRFCVHR